jgi:MYXO-CTERM domain-containing protein
MRSIAFTQRHQGVKVLGGEVTFTFKKDRLFVIGSTAIPHIAEAVVQRQISDEKAIDSATRWVRSDMARTTRFRAISGPVVLPLVGVDGSISTRTALMVTLDAQAPTGRWDVFVDVASGNVIARRQTLMFATATVNLDVPDRYPSHGRANKPARGLTVMPGVVVGADGKITFTGASASITIKLTSTFVKVLNAAGAVLNATATVNDGGTLNFSRATVDTDDSQLQTYISSGIIKARMKFLRPQLTWLDGPNNATVNINDVCNANSDGTDVNFFKRGSAMSGGQTINCENTGRILDVTMHENGHSFHAHVVDGNTGQFEGGLSEGISDYFAVDITEDPEMGKGFFTDHPEEPIRDLDKTPELTWPTASGEVHDVGEVIGSTLWDARKNFKAALGQAGADAFSKEFADALGRAVDTPSMYVEILASDDDDGNLANGTPYKCLIDEAFARHHLVDPSVPSGASTPTYTLTGRHISVAATAGNAVCPGTPLTGVKIDWKVRSNAAMNGVINMTHTGNTFEADLPAPADSIVLNYKLTYSFNDGTSASMPNNAADPFYEMYLGAVDTIYCTDFESDAFAAAGGWTHALTAGTTGSGADDWMWGVPQGMAGSGDPKVATSGTHVIGNDLGGTVAGQPYNGLYQASKSNQVVSPMIDLMGHTTNVRLQYKRWLTIEDGAKDKGEILVDGTQRWINTSTGNDHTDREWRFHDVDLSADAADGKVQITYKMTSDGAGNLGGWNIDDFCIVAARATAPACGDGRVDAGEQCDDGNTHDDDGCSATCQNEAPPTGCGNGMVEPGEQCDDGNTDNGDGCSAACLTEGTAVCGNMTREIGETCDDGNTVDGDGCSATCQIEGAGPECGNGVPETGEQCDDGNSDDTDGCKSNCTVPGAPAGGDSEGGCGCSVGGHNDEASGAAVALLLLAAGALWLTRRRRARA